MGRFCGNCFNETLNDQQICTLCGFDGGANRNLAPHALPAGTILNGRYIIGRVLGQGGFGITYTAKDHQNGGIVAIKEFFPDSMAIRSSATDVTPFQGERGENFVYGKETFLQEAQTMAEFIGNPNIVRVYSYFEENGTAYFAMEYVDGISYLAYLKSNGGKISFKEAVKYLYPVMDALSAVHEKNIIHRDVTPDNIYISKDGTVKLLDFGAARYSLGNASHSLDVILKHGFAPREQYKRRGRQGPFTDVYSLGATLYFSITGIRPDDALERVDEDLVALPSTLGVEISKQQEAALMKAMAVNPEDRFQTMAAFRDALEQAKPAIEQEKTPVSEKSKKAPVQKTKPKWLIPAVAAALVCIVGAVFALSGRESPSLSVEPTQMPVTEQTTPTVTADVVPETIPLTDEEIAYNEAVDLFYNEEYGKAAIAFAKLGDFRDAREISFKIWDAIAERDTISACKWHTVGLKSDGTVIATGKNSYEMCDLDDWTDIIAVSAGEYHTVGLKPDGTVVSKGKPGAAWVKLDDWTDIVAIDAGYNVTLGLKVDGTILVAGGEDEAFIGEISRLENVVQISHDYNDYAVKLSDGTIESNFNILDWEDVEQISAEHGWLARLMTDGTVRFTSDVDYGLVKKVNVSEWSDIVSVSMGWGHLLGLKSDGTVVATGDNGSKQCAVSEWTDIVAISAGFNYSAGLKSDGTVVTRGASIGGMRQTGNWKDIKLPADREALLAAINPAHLSNGTIPQDPDVVQEIPVPEKILNLDQVLMGVDDTDAVTNGARLFNTSVKRSQVASITFLDTIHNAPDKTADASAAQNGKVRAWAVENGVLFDVYVAADGGVFLPENSAKLFAELPCLVSIAFGDSVYTNHVANMSGMFSGCESLVQLDLSGFDTSAVTDMCYLFYNCTNLRELDLTGWDTSSAIAMEAMFSNCKTLTKLDLRDFDTSSVGSMRAMFSRCSSLTELDLRNFKTAHVTDMAGMFLRCEKLSALDLSSFDTSNVVTMNSMFMNCNQLKELNVSSFNVSIDTDITDMFSKCTAKTPSWYKDK